MNLSPERITEIQQFTNKLDLDSNQKELLKIRWLDTVKDYEKKAERDVNYYRRLHLAALISSLLIPVVANLSEELLPDSVQDILVSVLGLVAALSAGLNQLVNYRKRWAFYREQSHLIKQEGFAFLSLANQYKNKGTHQEAIQTFFGNIERIINESMKSYQDFFDTDEDDNMNVIISPVAVSEQEMEKEEEPRTRKEAESNPDPDPDLGEDMAEDPDSDIPELEEFDEAGEDVP